MAPQTVSRAIMVRLDREAVADEMTAIANAAVAGMGGCATACVDHADLPEPLLRIRRDEAGERLGRSPACLHQLEAERPVAVLGNRLRRDGADPCLGPGHARADAEGARLDRDAELARLGVARDD